MPPCAEKQNTCPQIVRPVSPVPIFGCFRSEDVLQAGGEGRIFQDERKVRNGRSGRWGWRGAAGDLHLGETVMKNIASQAFPCRQGDEQIIAKQKMARGLLE